MTEADLARLGRDELIALILEQAAAIAVLQAKTDELTRSGKRGVRSVNPILRPVLRSGHGRKGVNHGTGDGRPGAPVVLAAGAGTLAA